MLGTHNLTWTYLEAKVKSPSVIPTLLTLRPLLIESLFANQPPEKSIATTFGMVGFWPIWHFGRLMQVILLRSWRWGIKSLELNPGLRFFVFKHYNLRMHCLKKMDFVIDNTHEHAAYFFQENKYSSKSGCRNWEKHKLFWICGSD